MVLDAENIPVSGIELIKFNSGILAIISIKFLTKMQQTLPKTRYNNTYLSRALNSQTSLNPKTNKNHLIVLELKNSFH